jgi:polyribonucleotide nucleotidyltransferase
MRKNILEKGRRLDGRAVNEVEILSEKLDYYL